MSNKRVGIIGAGVIASTMHIPVLRAMPGVSIDWIMDANAERAAHLAQLHKTRAIHPAALADSAPVDFVLLALPLPPRAPYFEQLKDSQTVILAEKPLANTLAEHDALAAGFAEWRLGVGFQRRTYAQFRLMKRIIETRTFGALKSIHITEGGRTTRSGGGGDYQALPCSQGGGIVKNLGCHSLDLALWLSGAKDFSITSKRLDVDGGADFGCASHTILTTATGDCTLDFACSWLGRMQNAMRFQFEQACLVCAVSPSDHIVIESPEGQFIGKLDASKMGATTSAQAFYLEWKELMDAAESHGPQPMSAQSTRPVAALMDGLLANEDQLR